MRSELRSTTAVSRERNSGLELFTSVPRYRLLNLNTPIERLDCLRQTILGAPQLWIKRDDLTGYLGGGNKLRKLEYVMAHAQTKEATTIVTTGSITSNLLDRFTAAKQQRVCWHIAVKVDSKPRIEFCSGTQEEC